MHFGKEAWRTFKRGCEREWLVTNGLGGFASGTLIGVNTRRYHGLLIAALAPPVKRYLFLAKLDERIATGGIYYDLSANCVANGLTGNGFVHLQRAEFNPFPEFIYSFGHILLRKTVFMPYGVNATVVIYYIYNGGPAADLVIVPFANCRDYHGNTYRGQIDFYQQPIAGGVRITAREDIPPLLLRSSSGEYTASPDWFYGMRYPAEEERGLNPWEDHYLPGSFRVKLPAEAEKLVVVVASVGEGPEPAQAEHLLAKEVRRIEALEKLSGLTDPFARSLVRAADAFIVKRAEQNTSTILAGYPWFTDWGRDTMIALPGLTMVTGRYQIAREILEFFSRYVKEGLLPNFFPEGGQEPVYNTVDAALWYFQAVYKYLQYTGDEDFVGDLLPVMVEILKRYAEGAPFGIGMDHDGLITAGSPATQLTWMDAKVDDWVVTPRHGKAVEINALWYNAVCILENLCTHFGTNFPYSGLREKVRKGFAAFRHPDGYLYDVIREEDKDASVRPNQVFAVSLPHSPLSLEQARAVVRRVEDELYTPYGLRSLSSQDPAYRGRYYGDRRSRDAAYHQGTVWSWLIGPFVTAYRKVYHRSEASRERARAFLAPFIDHLSDHGIGHISEIFDGDEPHWPRGCFAQAWGVAEVLRAYVEDVLDGNPGLSKVEEGKNGWSEQRGIA
ncbi:MAG: amylo-alpha-1,6-glucosidase [Bacillota bacterium]